MDIQKLYYFLQAHALLNDMGEGYVSLRNAVQAEITKIQSDLNKPKAIPAEQPKPERYRG